MTPIIPVPAFADNYLRTFGSRGRSKGLCTELRADRWFADRVVFAEIRVWKNAF
jgi:hypothetical protein